jgi:hypothetical protein
MDTQKIRAFIDANRPIAEVQKQRWDGVDPSRLLEACELLEQAIGPGGAAGHSIVAGILARPRFQVDGLELAMWDIRPNLRGQEMKLLFVIPNMGAAGAAQMLSVLATLATNFPLTLKLER